ncbi:MAG: phosphoribosyltransferase [Bacteroidetes bacterium]|nr:phosphoribosyltransferase [Bacteroidota bacterium]
MTQKIALLSASDANIRLTRLAYEIYEHNIEEENIVLAGIRGQGYDIALQIKKKLEKICNLQITLLAVNINKSNPLESALSEDFDANGKNVILVDDVANSGKTLLYALRPFLQDIPKRIQIAVLVDRKHKQYPVSPDFTGLQVSTTLQQHIIVEIEKGKVAGAYLN